MKLLVVLCCAVALAGALNPAEPSLPHLTHDVRRMYRRLLHSIAPNQVKLADALDIKLRDGAIAGPIFTSHYNATFNGVVKHSYSLKHSYIDPEQKGFVGEGTWAKNDISEYLAFYHYGDAVKVHMLTSGGIHKEVVLGNPLDPDHKDARFYVTIPKSTYATVESLSEDEATFVTYLSVPALDPATAQFFTLEEMEVKFPAHADMFHELAKPGIHHDKEHHPEEGHGFDDKYGHHGRPDTHKH